MCCLYQTLYMIQINCSTVWRNPVTCESSMTVVDGHHWSSLCMAYIMEEVLSFNVDKYKIVYYLPLLNGIYRTANTLLHRKAHCTCPGLLDEVGLDRQYKRDFAALACGI
ncbi:hypothetical protein GDO86_003131 [Hymenochirus boettgeri]|uniref:Uncharacterized protein n=1 Tax=Hymenochirus boettgeri TaxID=247094 RepID=A0A8T2K886_9PIPI|nr:hypothetical protein GDO86_003131 [Hymenochirus boettgeri]